MSDASQNRFVVLCLQGFGDALEATPLVEQLRRNVPRAEIVVVAMRPQVRELYEGLPALVDRVLYIPFWEQGPVRASARFATLPLHTRSKVSFLTYPAARPEYAIFSRAVASERHYSHEYASSRLSRIAGRRATIHVPVARKHNVLRNLDLLAAAGFPVSIPTGYVVPASWNAPRERVDRVVMHVGSIAHHGLEAKRWPAASFLELGRILERESIEVVLLSGPAERDITAQVARGLTNATVFSGSLPEVARMIAGAAAVVANDNGIAHLAAGVGTPIIALMGPTPIEYGPYGKDALAYRPSTCPPCFDIAKTDSRCALDIDYACLKRDIRVDEVAATLFRLMRRSGRYDPVA